MIRDCSFSWGNTTDELCNEANEETNDVLARRKTRMSGTTPVVSMALTPIGREEGLRSRPRSPNTNPTFDIAIFHQLIFYFSRTGRRIILRTSWTLDWSASLPVLGQRTFNWKLPNPASTTLKSEPPIIDWEVPKHPPERPLNCGGLVMASGMIARWSTTPNFVSFELASIMILIREWYFK